MKVDVKFSLFGRGAPVPADHGYPLYSAISKILPNFHETTGVGVHPILGTQTGDRRMTLNEKSFLTIRIDVERIGELLPLSGKTLGFGNAFIQIGVPSISVLVPADCLRSRLVNIKGMTDPEVFKQAVRRQLDELDVSQDVEIQILKRRTFCVHDKNIIGFEVVLSHLSPEESVRVQEEGIGGRRKMGCGVFMPRKTDNKTLEGSEDNGKSE